MKKEKNDFLQLGLDNNNYGNYSFFFLFLHLNMLETSLPTYFYNDMILFTFII